MATRQNHQLGGHLPHARVSANPWGMDLRHAGTARPKLGQRANLTDGDRMSEVGAEGSAKDQPPFPTEQGVGQPYLVMRVRGNSATRHSLSRVAQATAPVPQASVSASTPRS
jgi:hypothetical protein